MDPLLVAGITIPENTAFLAHGNASAAGLLTPPPLTDAQASPLDENIPHPELISKYKELQALNTSLWSQIVDLQAQNNYWVQIYDYIEKGLAVKVKEMNTLVLENQQLKVRST